MQLGYATRTVVVLVQSCLIASVALGVPPQRDRVRSEVQRTAAPRACCLPNGECIVVQLQPCLAEGGIPGQPGTECDDLQCNTDLDGACCYGSDGVSICTTGPMEECLEDGGEFIGPGSECPSDPNTTCGTLTGACCIDIPGAPPLCMNTTPKHCFEQGGSFNGLFSTCVSGICNIVPPGACCFPNGGCANLSIFHCIEEGGVPLPPDMPCSDATCVVETGACCASTPQGQSCVVTHPGECAAIGGQYLGANSTCTDDPAEPCGPPVGACCIDILGAPFGLCVVTTAEQCAAQQGVYQEDHSTCASDVCEPQTGRCCLPDGCVESNFFACLESGGEPGAPGTVCTDDACVPQPTGACCVATPNGVFVCLETTAEHCAIEGGDYGGDDSTCAFGSCGDLPVGVCCLPDGCIELPFHQCLDEGGFPGPPGSQCGFVDCEPQDHGACCIVVPGGPGFCLETTAEHCSSEFGEYQGDGSHCDTVDCPGNLPPGACCFGEGTCINLPLPACLAEGGLPREPGTTCDDTISCATVFGACCVNLFGASTCFMSTLDDCEGQNGEFQGPNTNCKTACDPAPPGACCLPDGICLELDGITCILEGGIPTMPGVPCDNTTCTPAGEGACCVPTPSGQIICIHTTQQHCQQEFGSYQGDGSQCDDSACSVFEAACCLADGECLQLPIHVCLEEGGQPGHPGSTCDEFNCGENQDGACCIALPGSGGVCFETTPEHCFAENGEYQGDNTACDTVNCPGGIPPVPCCLPNGDCLDLQIEVCLDEGGEPHHNHQTCADGFACSPPMPEGGCCIPPLLGPGVCIDTTPQHCDEEGGQYQGDGNFCQSTGCPDGEVGRCCLPNGGCEELDFFSCLNIGGFPGAPGDVCDNEVCSQSACCLPNGSCLNLDPQVCAAEGGSSAGPGATCELVDCGPTFGACCHSVHGAMLCLELSEEHCLDLEGSVFQGPGTTCGDSCFHGPCCLPDGECVMMNAQECAAGGGEPGPPGALCELFDCGGEPDGACCFPNMPNGLCIVTTSSHCMEEGGEYQGDNTNCNPAGGCNLGPDAACCFQDGSCQDVPFETCADLGGTAVHPGVTCESVDCAPVLTGACCFMGGAGGGQCFETTANTCENQGGAYQGDGSSCANTCVGPEIACCLPEGGCVMTDVHTCLIEGGQPGPDDANCNDVECPPSEHGACCVSTFMGPVCIDTTLEHCNDEGGDFFGVGSSCDSVFCSGPLDGACCFNDGDCLELPHNACLDEGGEPFPNMSCDEACTPQPEGACCIPELPNGFCFVTTLNHCLQEGGLYQGDNTECDPAAECNLGPDAACCFPDGTCENIPFAACDLAGGTGVHPGVTCESVDCTPSLTGACCFMGGAGGQCFETTAASCQAQGGGYLGNGTTCPTTCLPDTACCLPNGVCTMAQRDACEIEGGVAAPPNTPCSQFECAFSETVACCFVNGPCLQLHMDECLFEGGIPGPPGSSCEGGCDGGIRPQPKRTRPTRAIR